MSPNVSVFKFTTLKFEFFIECQNVKENFLLVKRIAMRF